MWVRFFMGDQRFYCGDASCKYRLRNGFRWLARMIGRDRGSNLAGRNGLRSNEYRLQKGMLRKRAFFESGTAT